MPMYFDGQGICSHGIYDAISIAYCHVVLEVEPLTIVYWVVGVGAAIWIANLVIRNRTDAKLDKSFRYYHTMARGCLGEDELRVLTAELAEVSYAVQQVEGLSPAQARRMAKEAAIQSMINHLRLCAAFPDPDNLAYVKPS